MVTCIISERQRQSCCCLVAKLCPTLCNPMDCSTSGFPVLHYLPEFAQTHVHWVSDAILSLEHQRKVEVDRRVQFLEEMETGWVLSNLEFQQWEEPHRPQGWKWDEPGSQDNLLRPMAAFCNQVISGCCTLSRVTTCPSLFREVFSWHNY